MKNLKTRLAASRHDSRPGRPHWHCTQCRRSEVGAGCGQADDPHQGDPPHDPGHQAHQAKTPDERRCGGYRLHRWRRWFRRCRHHGFILDWLRLLISSSSSPSPVTTAPAAPRPPFPPRARPRRLSSPTPAAHTKARTAAVITHTPRRYATRAAPTPRSGGTASPQPGDDPHQRLAHRLGGGSPSAAHQHSGGHPHQRRRAPARPVVAAAPLRSPPRAAARGGGGERRR